MTFYIQTIFSKICSDIAIKCWLATLLVVSEFLIDSVLAKAMIALFVLVIFDMITAILVVRKDKTQKISSAKFVRTPIKMAIYFMLITAGRITEFSLPDAIGYLDDTILAFLTLTELISLLENTGKLGYAIPKKLLDKLHGLRDEK